MSEFDFDAFKMHCPHIKRPRRFKMHIKILRFFRSLGEILIKIGDHHGN
jgi:hypothetical protein